MKNSIKYGIITLFLIAFIFSLMPSTALAFFNNNQQLDVQTAPVNPSAPAAPTTPSAPPNQQFQIQQPTNQANPIQGLSREDKNGLIAIIGCSGCLGIISIIVFLIVGFLVYKDAEARFPAGGKEKYTWGVLSFVFGLIGLAIYIFGVRPKGDMIECPSCNKKYLQTLEQCPFCSSHKEN